MNEINKTAEPYKIHMFSRLCKPLLLKIKMKEMSNTKKNTHTKIRICKLEAFRMVWRHAMFVKFCFYCMSEFAVVVFLVQPVLRCLMSKIYFVKGKSDIISLIKTSPLTAQGKMLDCVLFI